MKRLRFLFLVVCLTTVSAYAGRQNSGQRLSSGLNLPRQQPRIFLPAMKSIDMSALSMEREPASGVTHLKGDAEVKMAIGPERLTILRADEVIYDPNTGDIETRGQVTICTSGTIGPNVVSVKRDLHLIVHECGYRYRISREHRDPWPFGHSHLAAR